MLKVSPVSLLRTWFIALIVLLPSGGGAPVASAQLLNSPTPINRVWDASLGEATAGDYRLAVEGILAAFEFGSGRRLVPGDKGRAGLKVYSASGPGISTPLHLVRAVIEALERRGFTRDQLFIVGLDGPRLRSAGFLPPLSLGGTTFDGVDVYALNTGDYYDPIWFYDNPLPRRIKSLLMEADLEREVSEDERKSFLAVPLMLDVDFWINLPSYTDHPVLGVNGALVNATLWNASNTMRFFRSPANAPAAVAEMAAIPELQEGWVCTLFSLDRYQFIGGPIFNSLYTRSEPRLWLSQNPVLLDALMTEKINTSRQKAGFRPLRPDLRILTYAEQIGLGIANPKLVRWQKVDPVPRSIP